MSDIIVILILILVNGLFSMSEVALISARKSRLESDARRGSRSARTALQLAADPDRFLSTIQIGITLIGILTGLYSGAALSSEFADMLSGWGLNPAYSRTVAQVTIVAVVTYLSIVVGELVPKRLGLAASVSVAKLIAPPMRLLSVIAMPAVWLLAKSTSLIVTVMRISDKSNQVTEEEIKSLIKDGAESGEVQEMEENIMKRAFAMGDMQVSYIMTPKSEITILDLGMDSDEAASAIRGNVHYSYPVYDSDRQAIAGIVTLRDLFFTIGKPGFSLSEALHPATFVPETMSVYDAMTKMRASGMQCVLICDEYGDLEGIVTMRDMLDTLTGAPAEPDYEGIRRREDSDSWLVDGQYPLYEFLSYFGREDLFEPESKAATIAGLILRLLRKLPSPGEVVTWKDFRFEIVDMDGARIDKIIVSLTPESSDATREG